VPFFSFLDGEKNSPQEKPGSERTIKKREPVRTQTPLLERMGRKPRTSETQAKAGGRYANNQLVSSSIYSRPMA
jgi:hypothetical protein